MSIVIHCQLPVLLDLYDVQFRTPLFLKYLVFPLNKL